MKFEVLEPPMAAPALTCAQINMLYDAARCVDHPIGRLVELAILAPGPSPAIAGCYVDRIDLRNGTVVIPTLGYGWRPVALGDHAMDLVEELAQHRTGGFLLADDHNEPLTIDAESSDYAIELLAIADERTKLIDWSIQRLRTSAFAHMIAGGVSASQLLGSAGLQSTDIRPEHARLEQIWVADYWTHLLALHRRALASLTFVASLMSGDVDMSFRGYAAEGCA